MAEGVIFGGYLLTKDQFLEVFEWFFQEYGDVFVARIINLSQMVINAKKKYTKQEIYHEWDAIQTQVFGNVAVDLMAAVAIEKNAQEYHYAALVDEKEYLSRSTISLSKNNLANTLLDIQTIKTAQDFELAMNKHYKDMIKSLDKSITHDEAVNLHIQYYYKKWSNMGEDPDFFPSTINRIIYGKMSNAEGKRMDAFMNHIGGHHDSIYTLLRNFKDNQPSALAIIAELYNSSVEEEEGDNFIPLLIDSLNNISWLAGGDIVIVGETGEVIYNIQLKTTQRTSQSFHIAINKLNSFLNQLLILFKTRDCKQIAEFMYEKLKNVSANEMKRSDEVTDEQIIEWAKDKIREANSANVTIV